VSYLASQGNDGGVSGLQTASNLKGGAKGVSHSSLTPLVSTVSWGRSGRWAWESLVRADAEVGGGQGHEGVNGKGMSWLHPMPRSNGRRATYNTITLDHLYIYFLSSCNADGLKFPRSTSV
jgi:hypothetical protein